MPTVEAELDRIVQKLHDGGAIWPRAELLRWYQDAYRQFLAESGAVRRWVPLDTPGRHTAAITQEWEDRHAWGGTVRKPTRTAYAGTRQTTGLWEVESLAGVTPTTSLEGVTQEWEKAHLSGDTDTHYRFTFPKDHERLVRLEWQNRRLSPVTTRELDDQETAWWHRAGEPRWWTTGAGRNRSVEVYEISTTYVAGYHQDALYGLPRGFSGTRTWAVSRQDACPNAWAYTVPGDVQGMTRPPLPVGPGLRITTPSTDQPSFYATQTWEREHLDGDTPTTAGVTRGSFLFEVEHGATVPTLGLGAVRRVLSPDRQYWPVVVDQNEGMAPFGRVSDWRSSEDTLMALEVVIPTTELTEESTPALIPEPLSKYLRYFVLARAFGRAGEGRNPILSDHYARRFAMGVALVKRLADITHLDRQWVREDATVSVSRPPHPRLPSTYPVER